MKIAVIGGTGGQGLGIATRSVKAGEDVIIGSRTIDRAEAAVAKVKEAPGFRAIGCGGVERPGILETITPQLIGLNIRNECQFGGTRITGLDRGRVC